MKDGITREYALQLFTYDGERLFWKERPAGHFSSASYAARFKSRFEGKEAGNLAPSGYRRVNIDGSLYFVHRVIWLLEHGRWPAFVDHINGCRDDNRLCNLRDASALQNNRNMARPSTNTSGVTGVSYSRRDRLWHAYIGVGKGLRKSLGHFRERHVAIAAREAAERELGYHPNHGRAA